VTRNALSLRLFMGVALGAAIIAVPFSLLWKPLGAVVFFAVFAALWLARASDPTTVLYCPYCAKRVKIGARACHHCGRSV